VPARPRSPANFRNNPQVWNSTQLNDRSPRAEIDDVASIRQLLDDLKEKLPYDEGRVFRAGHSNGGAMTFRLAAELSDRFAAIGSVAGAIIVSDGGPTKPLPTLYIIGTKDPLMPIEGGEVKLPWGGVRQNVPIAEPLADWAEAIGCRREPRTVSDQDSVKRVVLRDKRRPS
jgi:polyhydroxybutyrate depolymerase